MIQSEKNDQVTYRQLVVPTPDGDIVGFAIWYKSENQAKIGFKKFHDYISAPGDTSRSFNIEFEKDSPTTHRLKITIIVNEDFYDTEILGIDSKYVMNLKESLGEFQYYFITAGYDDANGEGKLLPLTEYNYFRQVIMIDGENVFGVRKKRWPRELFESPATKLISDDE